MHNAPPRSSALRRGLAALTLLLAAAAAQAGDAVRGIEQALNTALENKRGILLYVGGQTLAGAVTRIEAGQWVELRSQQWGKIVVRIDRIDAIAAT